MLDLDNINKDNKEWRTPDGYFDQLPFDIMEKIEESEMEREIIQKSTTRFSWWGYVGVAASIALLVMNIFLMSENRQMMDRVEQYVSENNQTPVLDEEWLSEDEIQDIQEYLVDNKMIYDAIYSEEVEE
ncbi:hypothetical protein K5X82_05280 [Halosquirtibacter xylanolyticus]|uniref:hypothetical protein n=1 Tax=Halosquirtibacter xylanolyticus TaxID=3374599 RepID=UPI003748D321|nr:hypothetical protein K5X82_05280 [Prolixibacteraceae bacterium]